MFITVWLTKTLRPFAAAAAALAPLSRFTTHCDQPVQELAQSWSYFYFFHTAPLHFQ